MKLFVLVLAYCILQNEPMLVGKQSILLLQQNADYTWFNKGIANYKSKKSICNKLKTKLDSSYKVVAICGTWCGDTKHLLPQFCAVMQQINFENVDYYFVDREKKSPENSKEKFSIDRIPTFIFYKNDKEIGRIVETVNKPIEKEILNLIEAKL